LDAYLFHIGKEAPMLDFSTPKGRIVAAALQLARERPWRDVTLTDVAKAADVNLNEVRRDFNSKPEILAAFVRAVDDEVLARAPKRAAGQSSRDAIFDVVMSRFDVMAPYRPALASIAATWTFDPALMRALSQSQAWMLRAADVSAEGLEGQLRATGLGAVYGSVFRTWLKDDDPGLARTMAALDRRLRRGEETLNSIDAFAKKVCDVAEGFRTACKRTSAPAQPKPTPEAPPPASA
jgi:ubiquinone biosynthesis protein COQ9